MGKPKVRVVLQRRPVRALAVGGGRVFFLSCGALRSIRKDGSDELEHGAASESDRLLALNAKGTHVLWRDVDGVTVLDLGTSRRTVLPPEAAAASAAVLDDETAFLGVTGQGTPSVVAWAFDGAKRWSATAARALAMDPPNEPAPDAIVGIGLHAEGRFVAWSDGAHTFLTRTCDGGSEGVGRGETLALGVSANGFDVYTVSPTWIVSRAQARVVGQGDFTSLAAIAVDRDRVFLVLANGSGGGEQLLAFRTSGAGKRDSVLAKRDTGRFTAIASDETTLFAATSEDEILGWE